MASTNNAGDDDTKHSNDDCKVPLFVQSMLLTMMTTTHNEGFDATVSLRNSMSLILLVATMTPTTIIITPVRYVCLSVRVWHLC